ncbi:MAG: DUF2852 domain-containing protein [Rhodobacteraceae bacterium]|nr:DUF2852 domain-containing protein [Paracoccaceae bacterium]MCY4251431.1 DUF2852 domain-containing protein [Paracoccaceae bacterium]
MDKVKQACNDFIGWMDKQGVLAWVAVMVVSFIVNWIIGLAVLFFLLVTNRFGKGPQKRFTRSLPKTENSAFEKYKAETLNRLAKEQKEFEEFLENLKSAKDQREFDNFMEQQKPQGS